MPPDELVQLLLNRFGVLEWALAGGDDAPAGAGAEEDAARRVQFAEEVRCARVARICYT
jgi:hypothetical protein